MATDRLNISLEDTGPVEVELTSNLMIAANLACGPLSTGDVDRILGVDPRPNPRSRLPLPTPR
jgi:hypothetical protein